MNSTALFSASMYIYIVSSAFYTIFLAFRTKVVGTIATVATAIGLLIMTIALGWRWTESYQLGHGHAPLSNLYESLVFFAWCIVLLYLYYEYKYKTKVMGAFITPFAFLAMAYATLKADASIEPLIPALQSNWLHAHVITCFIGYSAFAVSCGVGIMYLIKAAKEEGNAPAGGILSVFPSLDVLDELIYKPITIGFPFLTIGIIAGAVWANEAWGTYWSWDPKETWSLITWFVYAVFLHARITKGWHGKRTAWLSIIGFVATIFTYFGVNFLLSGLHSYGSE